MELAGRVRLSRSEIRMVALSRLVTCRTCKRVHYTLSLSQAQHDVLEMNKMSDEIRKGRHASLWDFAKCFGCGGSYRNMRPLEGGDLPEEGYKMVGILAPEESLSV
jgi:hypothetical protein